MRLSILPALSLVAGLSACSAIETAFPRTSAGFEAGGLLGAFDGATGALLARCRTAEGVEFRVALDTLAETTGVGDRVEDLRKIRTKACTSAGAAVVLRKVIGAAQ